MVMFRKDGRGSGVGAVQRCGGFMGYHRAQWKTETGWLIIHFLSPIERVDMEVRIEDIVGWRVDGGTIEVSFRGSD